MEWRVGTPKAIGVPVDVSGFIFDASLFQNGKVVAQAEVTVDPTTSRITAHIDEVASASFRGEHELRIRYTDSRNITRTLAVVPIEVVV